MVGNEDNTSLPAVGLGTKDLSRRRRPKQAAQASQEHDGRANAEAWEALELFESLLRKAVDLVDGETDCDSSYTRAMSDATVSLLNGGSNKARVLFDQSVREAWLRDDPRAVACEFLKVVGYVLGEHEIDTAIKKRVRKGRQLSLLKGARSRQHTIETALLVFSRRKELPRQKLVRLLRTRLAPMSEKQIRRHLEHADIITALEKAGKKIL